MDHYGYLHEHGPVCSAVDRVVVHESVHDELIERIVATADSTDLGPGHDDLDMSPVVSEEQFERITSYIEDGTEEGVTARRATATDSSSSR